MKISSLSNDVFACQSASNDNQFHNLPYASWIFQVLLHLTEPKEWNNVSLINKNFHRLSQNPRLLAAVVENKQSKSILNLEHYLQLGERAGSHLEKIDLSKTLLTDEQLIRLFLACPNIKTINLGKTNITQHIYPYLVKLQSLQSLTLESCFDLSAEVLVHIKNLPLKRLNLAENVHFVERLEYLQVFTQLEYLNLKKCFLISDNDLRHLQILTGLQFLNLTWCSQITDVGLKYLQTLIRLKSLKLEYCQKITDIGLQHLQILEELQFLDLSWCDKITDAGLNHLHTLTRLQSLNLTWCDEITQLGLNQLKTLPELKSLNIRGCTRLIGYFS